MSCSCSCGCRWSCSVDVVVVVVVVVYSCSCCTCSGTGSASVSVSAHFFDIWTPTSGPRLSVLKTHATTACTFSTLQPPKVVRTYGVLAFDFKTCFAPQWRALFQRLNCQTFVHFDFEMCFAPQRRALFRHLNFQKCSERVVVCTFWLRNVLRPTTTCTF